MSVAWSTCQRPQNASHEVATCTDQAGGWKTDPRGKDSQPFKVQWFWWLYSLKDLFVFKSNLRDIWRLTSKLEVFGHPRSLIHLFHLEASTWQGSAQRPTEDLGGPWKGMDSEEDVSYFNSFYGIRSKYLYDYFLDIHWDFSWILISIVVLYTGWI